MRRTRIPKLNRKLFDCIEKETEPVTCDIKENRAQSKKKTINELGLDRNETPKRLLEPLRTLTERQQLAILMRMTANSQRGSDEDSLRTPETPKSRNPIKYPENCRKLNHFSKRNERGETQLHLAAIRGDLKGVKRLLWLGASANCVDFAGWTPLHEACNYGWFGVAQVLLKANADVNARGLDDLTPLHDAAVNAHCKLVKLLLKNGAQCNATSVHGKTPLNIATDPAIIEVLRLHSDATGAGASPVAGGFLAGDARSHLPYTGNFAEQLTSYRLSATITPKHKACPNNMRKSSPQHQTPKGPDKPSSPRLTLRFQPIKPRDDKHGGASKTSEVSSSEPLYKSYCVTMETGEDSHDFKKGDVPVSSRRSSSSTPDSDAYDQQLNVVSSSSSNKDSTTSTAPPLPSHSHPLTTSNLPHLQLQGSLAADGIKETGSSSSRQRIMENHTSSGAPLINQSERHRGCENDSINASKGHCGKNGEGGGNGNHVRSMDYEDADMEVEHEDGRRKRKRDSKETGSGVSEPSSKMTSVVISGITMSLRNHNREKSSSVTPSEERKSPQEARSSPASASSKPLHQNSGSETESTQSDADNETGDGCASGGTHDAPHGLLQKVPPLKIVIPPTSLSEQDRDKSKVANRQALPYVVNASGDMSDSKVDGGCNNGASAISGGVTASDGSAKDDGKSRDGLSGHSEERTHRVTRSSQRMAALASASTSNSVVTLSPLQYATSGGGGGGGGGGNTNSSSSGGNSSGSNSGGATEHGTSVGQDISSGKVKIEPSAEGYSEEQNGPDMHPRKRKLRTREGHSSDANSVGHSSGSASSSWSSSSSHCEDQTILNSYEMYMNIRRQIDRRRRNMFVVQPKPPQNFKDYLMNRCSYVLAGNAASRLSAPMISPPQSLSGPMKELFMEQEKERYNLRLQHLIEKEKLVLMVEQETLRVHGRAARAMANQTVPFSVCTILKDEEVYNQLEPEQEEKERNARTRFTGRHLLSWLQDVSDKWEKVKEAMLLRHHNEAESLHAVQKLDWEWKMKELGMCDLKSTPVIDVIHVPMVHVSDDFDLLPV